MLKKHVLQDIILGGGKIIKFSKQFIGSGKVLEAKQINVILIFS
jgi:hypothetical protein